MDTGARVTVGDVLDLSIDLERVHLFGESGQTIHHKNTLAPSSLT
jgi:hypothetical protein